MAKEELKSISVLVDSREKCPLLFPGTAIIQTTNRETPCRLNVNVKKRKLDFGDYALEGYEDLICVERKGSQMELYKNFFNAQDTIRQGKALKRLTDGCKHPIMMVEVTPSNLLRTIPTAPYVEPEILVYRLGYACSKFGLSLMLVNKPKSVNGRRQLGSVILHTMLGYVFQERKEQ
jgi:hypothetical protein